MSRATLIFLALLSLPISAGAVPLRLDFTASNFVIGQGSDPVPEDPISGSIVYEAAGLGATIDALISIDLTIDGHSYSLAEVSFQSPWVGSQDIIYGSLNGIGMAYTSGVNDFWLYFDRLTQLPVGLDPFSYTTAALDSTWSTTHFDTFSITEVRVPEPMSLSLLGSGLLVLSWRRRRR